MTTTTSRATSPELLDLGRALADETFDQQWWRLLGRSPGASYFQGPDWVRACWRHAGRPPGVMAVWRADDGTVDAIVTLATERERLHPRLPGRVTIGTNLGSERPFSGDHGGWPAAPERRADVRRWLTDAPARPLLLRHVDAAAVRGLLPDGARRILDTRCPRLPCVGSLEEMNISSSLRKHMRRERRRLGAEGVSFRWVPPGATTARDFERLLELHRNRRELIGGGSSFMSATMADFHRELIGNKRQGHGPAMFVAEHGDRVIGVCYGFLWSGVFADYQGGWSPEWAQMSLGMVLQVESVLLAHAAGVHHFDLLRGSEPYKYRLGATDRVDQTWLVGSGAPAALLRTKYRMARRRQRLAGVALADSQPTD